MSGLMRQYKVLDGIKFILFDLEGTIIVNSLNFDKPRAEVKSMFVKKGVPKNWKFKPFMMKIKKAEEYLIKKRVDRKECEKLVKSALKIWTDYEIFCVQSSRLVKNAEKTFDSLKSRGVKLAIVSRYGEEAATLALEKFKLKDYFDYVLTRNDVKKSKPDPEALIILHGTTAIPYSNMLFVGDHVYDMQIGKTVGVASVGVLTGVSKKLTLIRAGADLVINDITELMKILS